MSTSNSSDTSTTGKPTPNKNEAEADKKKEIVTDSAVDLDDPNLFINRELSWLKFNHHVLEEALDERRPILERVKFLAIFSNNLDEFFMVRVSGLKWQLSSPVIETTPDGMNARQQLAAIRRELLPELEKHARCWRDDIHPLLLETDLSIMSYESLKKKQRKLLRRYFKKEVLPTLTPLAFDPGNPFPHISNLSINLAVVIEDPEHGERFARLKVPGIFPRLIPIPGEEAADDYESLGLARHMPTAFVWIEDVVSENLDIMFPGYKIRAAYPFRVTRDADQEIEEDEAGDLLSAMEEVVGMRHFGSVIRLEVDAAMPERIREILTENLQIAPYQVYTVDGPIGMSDLMELYDLDRPDVKFTPFQPLIPPEFNSGDIFQSIRKRDVLLYHPYDSFAPVMDFVRTAADDPDVLAIKQTLYRIGSNSPIVESLMRARENGKQVAVLVELKARFDEERNIEWAKALERAGVHVVYGLVGLKTHAKICLVVRREGNDIRRYVHLATGNYNEITAQIYTDMGLFTCNPVLGEDVSNLFNALTGYARDQAYEKLIVSPQHCRTEIIRRIEREIEHHEKNGDGYIAFKMNSLVDKKTIKTLYKASQSGIRIDLQVRGICCLRPGIKGVSDSIRVTSLVGRFLEHVRMYYFHNGGDDEILIGSADLMPRNLDRRVETLFPIEDPDMRAAIRDSILMIHLRDSVQARVLKPDGTYTRFIADTNELSVDSQEFMIENRGMWHTDTA